VAEQAAEQVLSLPMFPHMTPAQISHVCRAIASLDELLMVPEAIGV
jgi:dTDP-4-amino-4,6-dideoxygalactose transaminase